MVIVRDSHVVLIGYANVKPVSRGRERCEQTDNSE